MKKSLTAGISNPQIDYWYNVARRHGASGGKVLGAGAGGFLIFVADENRHAEITRALEVFAVSISASSRLAAVSSSIIYRVPEV